MRKVIEERHNLSTDGVSARDARVHGDVAAAEIRWSLGNEVRLLRNEAALHDPLDRSRRRFGMRRHGQREVRRNQRRSVQNALLCYVHSTYNALSDMAHVEHIARFWKRDAKFPLFHVC